MRKGNERGRETGEMGKKRDKRRSVGGRTIILRHQFTAPKDDEIATISITC